MTGYLQGRDDAGVAASQQAYPQRDGDSGKLKPWSSLAWLASDLMVLLPAAQLVLSSPSAFLLLL